MRVICVILIDVIARMLENKRQLIMNKPDPFLSRQIDLNLNLGQGFGKQVLERDLIPFATSVNISCGAHAGDAAQIDQAIKHCKEYDDLALGALISYPDLLGFGSRKIQLDADELRATVLSQLGALSVLAKTSGYEIQHVRPFGYLYDQMQTNYSVAETVIKAVQEFSKWVVFIGPSSEIVQEIGSWTNTRVALEARYDLRYRNNLSQVAFDVEKDSDMDLEEISRRARDLVYKSTVKTIDDKEQDIKFDTIHISSRLRNSLELAKLLRGMILKPLPLRTVDYEPYLSEFI